MPTTTPDRTARAEQAPGHELVERAYLRATGAPLVAGNRVRLLRDAAENYPAWLDSIKNARRTIHFESYIIHEDEAGREFAAALMAKAREGVRVRVIYDWMGAFGKTSNRFWRGLKEAGAEVRCYNPPSFFNPFGWVSRDHRKMIAVDGRVGYVTGLCVGQDWIGRPEKKQEPWRDTGVEVRGPAVADIERAFAQVWAATGAPLPEAEMPEREDIEEQGETSLRVVASEPQSAEMYRLDQIVAAGARRTLWLTDAYFVGTTTYVQALRAAARDGVDVRLLVPSSSDIPVVSALSRANYRALLEGGVRVFEWNGSMLHAKTAVADSAWARVGSTNLNMASWIGNYELDVAVEDERFAREMELMYEQDLGHATEIVISRRRRVTPTGEPEPPRPRRKQRMKGSAGRAAAGAYGIGAAVGAAITNRRALGPAEARIMLFVGLLLAGLSAVAILWPRVVTFPLAFLGIWVALALLMRSYKLHREGARARTPRPQPLEQEAGVGSRKSEVGSRTRLER
ncbi:MAG TPA: phospholipase D-like domain-containing protein [Pyrinomonadaceae bacterium]|nr:phospholipase D-like domain-containing protein [Pyrinomonadaceae bacterium]